MVRLLLCSVAVLLLILDGTESDKALPSYVKACSGPDGPQKNQCVLDAFNDILPKLANGLPELGLRKAEPYDIEKVDINFGTGSSVNLDAVLTNMKMYGMSAAKANKIDLDTKQMVLKVDLDVPRMQLVADFKAKGKVLLFQFDSKGIFNGNMTGIHSESSWQCINRVRKGESYCQVDNPDINIIIKDIKIHFENLFPTAELNSHANQAINENIDVLYDELKPIIVETVKSVFVDAVNRVHKLFAYQTLYPQ